MPHCQKILKPWRGIQYVEHTEGNGGEMFKAIICKLGLEGIVSKKARRALQVRSIKGVAENQKSEGTRCHPRYRRHLLRGFPPFSVISVWKRTEKILIRLCANERDAKIRAALDPQGERGPDLTPSLYPRGRGQHPYKEL